jgi:hypothetical protein
MSKFRSVTGDVTSVNKNHGGVTLNRLANGFSLQKNFTFCLISNAFKVYVCSTEVTLMDMRKFS